MGQQRGLAQEIVAYMYDHDFQTLHSEATDTPTAIMEAYDTTMGQLQGDGWTHVAWYLITQLAPSRDEIAECEAYDLLERLFAYHGIG
jgi:hypothetical protein